MQIPHSVEGPTKWYAPETKPGMFQIQTYRLERIGVGETHVAVYVPVEWDAADVWWNVLAGYAALAKHANSQR